MSEEQQYRRCFPDAQPGDLGRVYVDSFCWLLDQQNRDGSWGRTYDEKCIYTPHGLQLLLQAGFAGDHRRLREAIRWLKESIPRTKRPLWFGRIPALALAGEGKWLRESGDIDAYLEDLERSRVGDFFWYVLPIMTALSTLGENAPYAAIAEQLAKYEYSMAGQYVSVVNKPNHTGLAAVFLHSIDSSAHAGHVRQMVNWILADHRAEDTGVVHWDNSIGVTAYVLMDLATLGILYEPEVIGLVSASLRFFRPTQDGSMPPDRFTTTFDTTFHEDRLYTTLLALRAMASVFGRDNCVMRSAVAHGIDRCLSRSWRHDVKRFILRHRRMLVTASVVLVSVTLISILLILLDIKNAVVNVVVATLGVVFGVLMDRTIARLDSR